MRPTTWLFMVILMFVSLIAIFQIPLVTDVIATTGYSSGEVFAGVTCILLLFYLLIGIFTVRG